MMWGKAISGSLTYGVSQPGRVGGQAFGGATSTIFNLTGSLALIVAPLGFWFFRGRFEVVIVTLPALYSHGVYAVASHFIPRYAQPEIPLRVVATMLLLSLHPCTSQATTGRLHNHLGSVECWRSATSGKNSTKPTECTVLVLSLAMLGWCTGLFGLYAELAF